MTIQQENSRTARVKSEPRQLTDKQRILYCLQNFKSVDRGLNIDVKMNFEKWLERTKPTNGGLSPMQIVEASHFLPDGYGISYHAVQRRVSELVREGKIKCVGSKDGFSLYALIKKDND